MSEQPPAKKARTFTAADKLEQYVNQSETYAQLTRSSLLETGMSADFIIKAGDRTIKAHRGILELNHVFAAACKEHWKEGSSGVYECKEDSPDAIRALINFLYTKKFGLKSDVIEETLENCLEVYAVAHKYMEPELMQLAQRAYVKYVPNVDQSSCKSLIEQAKMIYSHPELAKDTDIRRAIATALIKHAKNLFDREAESAENRVAFGQIPGIQVDLALIGTLPSSKTTHIPDNLFQLA